MCTRVVFGLERTLIDCIDREQCVCVCVRACVSVRGFQLCPDRAWVQELFSGVEIRQVFCSSRSRYFARKEDRMGNHPKMFCCFDSFLPIDWNLSAPKVYFDIGVFRQESLHCKVALQSNKHLYLCVLKKLASQSRGKVFRVITPSNYLAKTFTLMNMDGPGIFCGRGKTFLSWRNRKRMVYCLVSLAFLLVE